MRIFVDMDGTLAKWNNVEFEQLFEEGYFRNLEPNVDIVNEVRELIRQGENVYVLSCYLTESNYAKEEKQQWLKQYLPQLHNEKQIFVPFGTNKAEYLKEHYSPITNEDYLVDDYTQNLLEWKQYGGIGVKYLNGINHTRGTWQGLRVADAQEMPGASSLNELLLSEKLKPYNIKLMDRVDLLHGRTRYRFAYYGTHYSVGIDTSNLLQNNVDQIIYTIKNGIAYPCSPFTYFNKNGEQLIKCPADIDYCGMEYYNRRYPTLSKHDGFKNLCADLHCSTLDAVEYTLFLCENGLIQFNPQKDGLHISPDAGINLSMVYPETVKWREGVISLQDMMQQISYRAIAHGYEIYQNSSDDSKSSVREKLETIREQDSGSAVQEKSSISKQPIIE